MADISKIKLPNNSVVNIKDARITGVDSTPTSNSTNVVESGGVYSAIQSAIGSVYRVKGTKATYANLPSSGNVIGDVWNVEAAYDKYPAGTNWVWTGSAWDALGGTVDLSSYLTKTEASNTYLPLTGGTLTGDLDVNGTFRVLNTGGNSYAKLLVYPTNPYGIVFKSNANGTMSIQSQRESNDSETYPLVLNPGGGNVGVGTSSPSQKFEVNGNIKATSFIKTGGTSSQFLKADGSVDSNTYATTAQLTNGSVTKLGTATVGSSVRPIYLNAGAPTAITKVATDYIGWTSVDHSGLTSIENLFYTSGTNAFAYLNVAKVDVEYSNDGGTTWVDYGLNTAEKVSVFTYSGSFLFGKKTTSYTTNDSVRVTIHAGCGVYCKSEFLVIRHNFPGTTELKIERTTYASQDTYEVLNTIRCSGNPDFRVIPLSAYLFGNNGIHDLRITATYVGPSYPTVRHYIAEIRLYASNVYSYPSNYARYRHLYSIDAAQNAIFPAGVTSSTLSVTGNITTSGYVAIGTGSSNGSYIGSDTATNIFLHNSAGAPLVADGLVVRRGTSSPTATLGNTSYPWGGVYSTSFVKSGGTSSQFLKADGSVDSNTYALASTIPAAVTESTVSGWGFTKNAGTLTGVKFNGMNASVSNGVASITASIPTVDATPTISSTNAVSSGGVYAELTDVVHEGNRIGSESYVDSGSIVTDLSGYALKTWVEAKGYLTQETDPTVPAWAKAATKPTYTASEVGALPNTTVIPTKLTQLTNDAGFIVGYTETDPTVPAWAKAASKPTYAASEITNDVGYLKYVLLQSESAMPANPDSGTLYLIPE